MEDILDTFNWDDYYEVDGFASEEDISIHREMELEAMNDGN